MHTRNELEERLVEKGRLSCDSDAPQVGARSKSTRVVKVNCKTNHRKTRPYCKPVGYPCLNDVKCYFQENVILL